MSTVLERAAVLERALALLGCASACQKQVELNRSVVVTSL
jgi:hypothetical protein